MTFPVNQAGQTNTMNISVLNMSAPTHDFIVSTEKKIKQKVYIHFPSEAGRS